MAPLLRSASLTAALIVPVTLLGQEAPRPVQVLGSGDAFLFGTKDVAIQGSRIAVLTEPEPAVHVFGQEGVAEWGGEGGGPAELRDPVDLVWDREMIVLDMGNRKLVRFDEGGRLLHTRPLDQVWANRLEVVRGDTLLGAFAPMADARAVLRIRGEKADTLLAYASLGASVRLEAQGAPSLTVKEPFTPQVRWTALHDGVLAWYDPRASRIELRTLEGEDVGSIAVDWSGLSVESSDREWWIENAIPEDFMGRRVFEPLRPAAREQVEFPERLPPVLDLIADPSGGLWVRRTPSSRGETWRLVHRNGRVAGELRLPAGRELLAVGASFLAALARNELDVERVELYERPRWAGT